MSVDTSNASAAAGVDSARVRVAGAIKQAAGASGTNFQYLLATAKMESDFNPSAGAPTSSAHGLFQFIDQTWLATFKDAGAQLGYGSYADMISKSSDGTYTVADPAARNAIMKLRDDPAVASDMAAALTQSNSFQLTGMIGRRPTDGELYMAHFMGVGGAAKLIGNAEDNPQASAARLFPNAAAANRSIFYDRITGRARSVSEVYSVLQQRYASAAMSSATQSAMASVGGDIVKPAVAIASATTAAPLVDSAAYLSTFPDTRSAAPAPTASATPVTLASVATTAATAPSGPVFRSLFQDGGRAQPVSQAVRELWGNSASLTSDRPASPSATTSGAAIAAVPASSSGGRLDLFSDRSGTFSG
jgi:hypothetical protein